MASRKRAGAPGARVQGAGSKGGGGGGAHVLPVGKGCRSRVTEHEGGWANIVRARVA